MTTLHLANRSTLARDYVVHMARRRTETVPPGGEITITDGAEIEALLRQHRRYGLVDRLSATPRDLHVFWFDRVDEYLAYYAAGEQSAVGAESALDDIGDADEPEREIREPETTPAPVVPPPEEKPAPIATMPLPIQPVKRGRGRPRKAI